MFLDSPLAQNALDVYFSPLSHFRKLPVLGTKLQQQSMNNLKRKVYEIFVYCRLKNHYGGFKTY